MWGDIKRLVLVACGALAAAALLIAVLGPALGAGACTVTAPLGWIVPIISVGVIAALAWSLLLRAPRDPRGGDEYHAVACPSCGRAVLTDWRLCPYCGSALARSGATGEQPEQG